MIRHGSSILDARLLRLALAVACVWNCVLPSLLYACRCTGGIHMQAGEGCASCSAKNAVASCCQGKEGQRSCCQAGQTCGFKSAGQIVSAGDTCSSGCCQALKNEKVPAVVAAAWSSSSELSFVSLAILPATIDMPVVEAQPVPDSIPPPSSSSRQALLCVWRN